MVVSTNLKRGEAPMSCVRNVLKMADMVRRFDISETFLKRLTNHNTLVQLTNQSTLHFLKGETGTNQTGKRGAATM